MASGLGRRPREVTNCMITTTISDSLGNISVNSHTNLQNCTFILKCFLIGPRSFFLQFASNGSKGSQRDLLVALRCIDVVILHLIGTASRARNLPSPQLWYNIWLCPLEFVCTMNSPLHLSSFQTKTWYYGP